MPGRVRLKEHKNKGLAGGFMLSIDITGLGIMLVIVSSLEI
jgi:hypothetical protein